MTCRPCAGHAFSAFATANIEFSFDAMLPALTEVEVVVTAEQRAEGATTTLPRAPPGAGVRRDSEESPPKQKMKTPLYLSI